MTHQSTSVVTRNRADAAHSAPRGVLLHAVVEPVLHEQRPGERQQRVEHDEGEADEERGGGTAAGTCGA